MPNILPIIAVAETDWVLVHIITIPLTLAVGGIIGYAIGARRARVAEIGGAAAGARDADDDHGL